MHAEELRMAVTKIVDVLKKADIHSVLDQYRSSKGDQRTKAAAQLGHAGAVIIESIDSMSPAERQVVKCLHLDALGSAQYWQDLLGSVEDPKRHQAEIVRLASRVIFASSHMPGLFNLLETVESDASDASENEGLVALEEGEGGLLIRLTDAGERASDPDRVARAIDGVDMLYSACASIARKPAMDLRLDEIASRHNRDRVLRFTGERESLSAVYAVIDSIPAALASIDHEQNIDLNVVVQSLPVFEDLNTLASLGTFSKKDWKDISETMHQGALLTLESGVILMDNSSVANVVQIQSTSGRTQAHQSAPRSGSLIESTTTSTTTTNKTIPPSTESAEIPSEDKETPARDEHYDRYLREREAMLHPQEAVNGHTTCLGGAIYDSGAADQHRRDAVDELLKSLGQSRSS